MDNLLIEWKLYYQRCLFSGLELHARYDWQDMIGKLWLQTHIPVFPIHVHHLCILTCITWTIQVVQTLYISNNCSTCTFLTSLCGLKLHERFNWKAMAPDTHHSHSLIQHCVCMLQALTYITIWCATTHDNKTHIAYDCITHQTMTLLPMMHCFIKTKSCITTFKLLQSIVSTYTLQCLSITANVMSLFP